VILASLARGVPEGAVLRWKTSRRSDSGPTSGRRGSVPRANPGPVP
jgi:hypothetical protein